MSNSRVLDLNQLLKPELVRVGLPGRTKQEVIDQLVDCLAGHPAVTDLERMRAAVFEREDRMSTGVGKGVGLPHAKTPAVRASAAAFAVTAEPVDFGAIDGEPVRLAFLLVGTEAAKSQHIKIMSRVSRLLNRDALRQRLIEAKSPAEVLALLEEGELQLLSG